MLKHFSLLAVAGAALLPFSSTHADPTFARRMSYQAALRTNLGEPVAAGEFDITFELYDALTGGNQLWSEQQLMEVGEGGLVSAELGSVVPLHSSLFVDTGGFFINSIRYLQVIVENDTLSPRTRLNAVPYAEAAARLAGEGFILCAGQDLEAMGPNPSILHGDFGGFIAADNSSDTMREYSYVVKNLVSSAESGQRAVSESAVRTRLMMIRKSTGDTLRMIEQEINDVSPSLRFVHETKNRLVIRADHTGGHIQVNGLYSELPLSDLVNVTLHNTVPLLSLGGDVLVFRDTLGGDTSLILENIEADSANQRQAYFAGRVGVGIASPQSPLHVVGTGSVAALTARSQGTGAAIKALSAGSGPAILGQADSTDLLHLASLGPTNLRLRVDNLGNVCTDGAITQNGGCDVAENMAVSGDLGAFEAGAVVALDRTLAGRVVLATEPYSKLVAGIVSSQPGFHLAANAFGSEGFQVPVALTGVVPCHVTADNGPIAIGDLLVSSDKPGVAMKASDGQRTLGAILGKAMEPWAVGDGDIKVLVSLQ